MIVLCHTTVLPPLKPPWNIDGTAVRWYALLKERVKSCLTQPPLYRSSLDSVEKKKEIQKV